MTKYITPQSALRSMLAIGLLTLSHSASAQVAVIVNSKSAIADMTPAQASSIFLGKSSTLPSGNTALPIDLPDTSVPHEQFYSKASGKTSAQVKASWARLIFSGKATPPKEVANSSEVKKIIVSNPDAIGYIEKSAVDSTVKVVLVID
jgi:ABC-type phosphate transport system substrate-binding protein